jgi:hypothetical protein
MRNLIEIINVLIKEEDNFRLRFYYKNIRKDKPYSFQIIKQFTKKNPKKSFLTICYIIEEIKDMNFNEFYEIILKLIESCNDVNKKFNKKKESNFHNISETNILKQTIKTLSNDNKDEIIITNFWILIIILYNLIKNKKISDLSQLMKSLFQIFKKNYLYDVENYKYYCLKEFSEFVYILFPNNFIDFLKKEKTNFLKLEGNNKITKEFMQKFQFTNNLLIDLEEERKIEYWKNLDVEKLIINFKMNKYNYKYITELDHYKDEYKIIEEYNSSTEINFWWRKVSDLQNIIENHFDLFQFEKNMKNILDYDKLLENDNINNNNEKNNNKNDNNINDNNNNKNEKINNNKIEINKTEINKNNQTKILTKNFNKTKEILILRNQILYERFLRIKYENTNKKLFNEISKQWEKDMKIDTLKISINQKINENKSLKDDILLLKSQNYEFNSKLKFFDSSLLLNNKNMNKNLKIIKDENLLLKEKVDSLNNDIQKLNLELFDSNHQLFFLKIKENLFDNQVVILILKKGKNERFE